MAKLFNTIIVYDVYTWAENEEDANAAALAMIRDHEEPEPPSEQNSLEVNRQPVRAAWLAKRPIVGAAVSDADFERVKGKTCEQVHAELTKKPDKKTDKAK
jgi:hypothetical protein